MEEYQAIGPGRLYLGDATQSGGAGMDDAGDHEDATFAPNITAGYSTSANTGDMPLPNSIRTIPAAAMMSIGLLNQSVINLANILREHVTLETGDGGEQALASYPQVSKLLPTTACFVPEEELALGAAAPNAIWIPSCFPNNVGDLFQYGRLSEGDNASPFTLELMSVRTPEDMGTDASWFVGDPTALGLTWSRPTP